MALSVKVALLTCLFFTGGLCWLVNQVGRPASGPAHSLSKRAPQAPAEPPAVAQSEPAAKPALLERESPVARAREVSEPTTRTVVVPEIRLVSGPAADQPIPPLHNPLLEMRTAAAHAGGDVIVAEHTGDRLPDDVYAMESPSKPLPEVRRPTTPYTVRKGDSLGKICREQFGPQASEGQRLLLAANPQIVRRAKNTIFEGETIQLPQLETAPEVAAETAPESDGMEASASFVTQIVAEPPPEEALAPTPAKPVQRTSVSARMVKTPPKSDAVRKSVKPAQPKPSAKASPRKSTGAATVAAAPPAKSKAANGVQTADARNSKTTPATARRAASPAASKAASGKRAPNPDKKDARRAGGGNVMLARRD